MIDERKIAAMRKAYADRKESWPYVGNLFECLDTLEAALRVVRAAEAVLDDVKHDDVTVTVNYFPCDSYCCAQHQLNCATLNEALAPFRLAPADEE